MDDGNVRVRVDLIASIELVLRCTVDGERRLPRTLRSGCAARSRERLTSTPSAPRFTACYGRRAPDASGLKCIARDTCPGLPTRSRARRWEDHRRCPFHFGARCRRQRGAPPDGEADIELFAVGSVESEFPSDDSIIRRSQLTRSRISNIQRALHGARCRPLARTGPDDRSPERARRGRRRSEGGGTCPGSLSTQDGPQVGSIHPTRGSCRCSRQLRGGRTFDPRLT